MHVLLFSTEVCQVYFEVTPLYIYILKNKTKQKKFIGHRNGQHSTVLSKEPKRLNEKCINWSSLILSLYYINQQLLWPTLGKKQCWPFGGGETCGMDWSIICHFAFGMTVITYYVSDWSVWNSVAKWMVNFIVFNNS